MVQDDEIRLYVEPPRCTEEEVAAAIARDDPDELRLVPISVSLYHDDLEWSQAICIRLSAHRDPIVRGNAVLSFCHLARRFGELDEPRVRPIIQSALRDADVYVREQANDILDEVGHHLGWQFESVMQGGIGGIVGSP